MKKTILFLMVGALIFGNSCKKDEEETAPHDTTPTSEICLLTRIDENDGNFSLLTYNSNNLITEFKDFESDSSVDDIYSAIYDNNKLSKMDVTDGNDNLLMRLLYEYNGNLPTNMIYIEGNDTIISTFYHNSNHKLDSIVTPEEFKMSFTWNGDNVSEIKTYNYNQNANAFEVEQKIDYEFDDKNNPKHNIGINYFILDDDMIEFLNKNNIIKKTAYINHGTTLNNDDSKNYINEYNDKDNIIKSTIVNFNNDTTKIITNTYTCN